MSKINYLETLKNITKNKEKRVENIVLLIVLLVVILLAGKYIFAGNSDKTQEKSNSTSKEENINVSSDSTDSVKLDLENRLSQILSEISGISEVSVVITYLQDNVQTPVYNTKEQVEEGKKTTEKNVAYNEDGSKKTAIIESVQMPKIEGAMIVAKGASTVEIRSKIATAVATLTNVPVYKIQVFEK